MRGNRIYRGFDRQFRKKGFSLLAGMDEAGRGPLAGPVVAACVILNPHVSIPGIRDSKKLTPQARERLYEKIMEKSLSAGVAMTSPARIDTINILEATKEAMRKAYRRLTRKPNLLLVDALHLSGIRQPQRAILQGDEKSESIAAASIIAKVTRDRIMREYALQYPEYGFERHKGYPTASHRKNLMHLGPCPIHRRSFKPVLSVAPSSIRARRCSPRKFVGAKPSLSWTSARRDTREGDTPSRFVVSLGHSSATFSGAEGQEGKPSPETKR